jgi:uncharacterized protein DUF1566
MRTIRNLTVFSPVLIVVIALIGFPAAVFADSANLPQTGQSKCYHQDGYEMECPNTGQDGDIKAGVAWPAQRFTDNADGTITDNLTGLMWLKDAECLGSILWQAALDDANDFNQDPASYNCHQYNHQALSYTDWRVPNINELASLVNAGEAVQATWLNDSGFYNMTGGDYYWSSTTFVGNSNKYAWAIDGTSGEENFGQGYKTYSNRVMLVRAAQ